MYDDTPPQRMWPNNEPVLANQTAAAHNIKGNALREIIRWTSVSKVNTPLEDTIEDVTFGISSHRTESSTRKEIFSIENQPWKPEFHYKLVSL